MFRSKKKQTKIKIDLSKRKPIGKSVGTVKKERL